MFVKQKWFQCGNKPGKLLANLLAPRRQRARILALISRKGIKLKTEEQKVIEVANYYRSLYKSTNPPMSDKKKCLNVLILTKISSLQAEIMDHPVSLEEIKLTISLLKGNMALGLDGFTEFLKNFLEKLYPVLQILYNSILSAKEVPNSWKEVKVILLSKPNKDSKKIEPYCPISLLNID